MPTANAETVTANHAPTPKDTTASSSLSPRDAVNWFEIPSLDFDRAIAFYEAILGTSLRRESYGEEIAIFPSTPTGVGGAVVHRKTHLPSAGGALIYINADGILEEAVARVPAMGGTVKVPVTAVAGGFGSFACIVDSEGNSIGLHAH